MSEEFLNRTFLGNPVENYIWLIGIILAGFIFKQIISKIFSWIIYRIFKRYTRGVTMQQFHDLLRQPFSVFFLLVIGYIAFNHITFPVEWKIGPEDHFGVRMTIQRIYQIILLFSITWIFLRIVDFCGLIFLYRASLTESRMDDQLIPFFRDGLKIFIVVVSFFFVLGAVFRVNIVTLIGGLGIGGLAVALAAKETLENLFGSFTIFLDKPFIVGDHVKIGVISGHVEKIGLRSTRIRTLEKSLVTVPNKKMVDAESENITERTFWRARQEINLVYSTTAENLTNIMNLVRIFLEGHEKIREGVTVKFEGFGLNSLNVLLIYFVRTADGDEFLSVKEEVNFKLMEIVRANHSDFAFPTTQIIMEKTNTQ